MARLLPPYIGKDCKSGGERMIFELLKKNTFAKDWIILHSLNLAQHTIRLYGEIDFLLLIPNGGIFIMEVKGGDVRCTNGTWEFIGRFGNIAKNKSPFNQARDAMFSLKAAIKREFGTNHKFNKIQFGFFVAFPQVTFNKHSVEYEPWQILDKEIYNSTPEAFFNNLIYQFTQKHKEQYWFSITESLPTRQDLEQICDFLRGDFERVRTPSERLNEFDNHVKSYTLEQFRVLDSIQINERSVIEGSAGTGKTMIAIESAKRAASEGQSVFLTCYNRFIGEWMQQQLADWERVTVSNLHNYLFELSKGYDYDKAHMDRQDFYTKYLPSLMENFFRVGLKGKFDKIIIDEGQDLIRKEYLELFDSMIEGGMGKGNWEIYGDFESQAIYSSLTKAEMFELLNTAGHYCKFLLKINCRNTRQIGEETALISGFAKPPFLLEFLEGIPVNYFFYKNEAHQKEIVNEQLKRVVLENVGFSEMIILSPKKFENSILKSVSDHKIKELRSACEISGIQNYFMFVTIQAYKGMEANFILIADIEELSGDFAKSLMYVGMSRARYGLILLIAEARRSQYYDILKNKLS